MRRSELFIKTRHEAPADEPAKNAQLLIRAGYVHKEMAGVYSYLPLGKKVLENIMRVIREEMDAIGGVEMQLSTLQDKQIWEATERWESELIDVWFKTSLQGGGDLGLAWSHEEPMARMMSRFVNSYKDLPVYAYQFQNKLRNELRAKNGLLRAREFIMKDLYSFSKDRAEHEAFYERITLAYERVYQRLGIGDITYKTFASGGPFSKFSHEFQTISPVGEDTVYLDETKKLAVNKEVLSDKVLTDLGLSKNALVEKTAVEVGNIFTFGSRYSEPLGLFFTDERGISQPVFMGSYGIGVSRLMGLLAEHFADAKGLVWPKEVAPAQVYLIHLGEDIVVAAAADELYKQLTDAGVGVIYDNRDERAGEMFADADLMGIPIRLVLSDKTLAQNQIELKVRDSETLTLIPRSEIIQTLAKST